MKRFAIGLTMGTAAMALASMFAIAPAQARDWDDGGHRSDWRGHEWRAHGWRDYDWRVREGWARPAWAPYGYYPEAYYAPPPVVYPRPGVSIVLPLR